MSEVKVFKLTTGEEIIGAATFEEGDKIHIDNPMLVAVSNDRLVFIPYMQYTTAKEKITISNEHVMFVVDPVDSIRNDYNEATGRLLTPRARTIEVVR